MTATRTLLAAQGDVNDVRTWSGTPYHLLQIARRAAVIDEGLALQPLSRFRNLWRYGWNLHNVLRGRGRGGYQFSATCLEQLWKPVQGRLAGARVVNCFQLYPPSVLADRSIEKWFYIDQTLRDLFDDYGLGRDISTWTKADAIAREREGYARAAGIVTHSHWAARRLMEEYGVSQKRLQVIVPGANLDAAAYPDWAANRPPPALMPESPLRLVFVGKDALRKGLDRLIRAVRLARSWGADCTLTVIGCEPARLPPELRESPGVHWRGFIDKQRDPKPYLDAVAAHDVGCLLSRAEAGGMCLREFHALGLAVIAPDVGGSPDHALAEASHLVNPDAGDVEIAALLHRLAADRAEVTVLRARSWAARESVLWPASVTQLARTLDANP